MKTNGAFDPLHIAIVILTLATALIHIFLLFPNTLFILNGIGYLLLAGALFAPIPALSRYHSIVRWLLIAYVAITVALWWFWGARSLLGYTTAILEVALIILLWLAEMRASAKPVLEQSNGAHGTT